MLTLDNIGEAYWVRPRVGSFQLAIALAVRPEEATHISGPLQLLQESMNLSFAAVLSLWFRAQRASGWLRYIPDPDGPLDFWCSPETTLERGGGDCDDLAVLAASILQAAGMRANVIVGTFQGVGHAWVEAFDERGWFLFEATIGAFFRKRRPRTYVRNPYIA
jgi:transglutaminase-like putative cysteine protease